MKILGIETSCDETAISIIEAEGDFDGGFSFEVLGNALLSQADKHAEYGGVYPSLAKREHAKNLTPMLQVALTEADMLTRSEAPETSKEKLDEIKELLHREPELFAQLLMFLAQYKKPEVDAIAVTIGPGLEPALWVGVNFARALSEIWNIPIVAVNHMEGHIIISAIQDSALAEVKFPALALLISGGHTELVLMDKWLSYKKIGQTRDDAVGEAFDKTARLLGLPYPGGPQISHLAHQAREKNLDQPFSLPRPMLHSDDADFSFSGLKTAVRKLVEEIGEPTNEQKKQIAREFEDAAADVFVSKVKASMEKHNIQTLIMGGGVSANTYIKERIGEMVSSEYSDASVFVSPPERATDNALMIALAGYFRAQKKEFTEIENLKANGNLSLSNLN
jgi:N6-L-threonylcarbamoyladenine synthase